MVRLMLVLGLVLSLVACSGGDRIDGLSEAEEAALQERVDVAEAARIKAEEEKATADAGKTAAEEETRIAEEEQERQRKAAEDALLAAEAAKREQDRLKAERDEAERKQLQTESSVALMGLGGPTEGPAFLTAPTVTPTYRAPADVSATGVTFTSPRGSSARKWYATTASNQGQITDDTIVVYSDVNAPKPTPIMDVHTAFAVNDADTHLLIQFTDDSHKNRIAASGFPTGGSTREIPLTIDSDPTDGNDADDRTALISGRFDGASGHYQCTDAGSGCSVRHTGAGYEFEEGTWTFRTSKNSKVNVADRDFMHFGWWRRKTNASGAFSYGTFSSAGRTPADTGDFNDLEGSADYEGPAIGQYAIYQPLGTQSNHGEFKATARFTANFGTNMLSGSVSGFDVNPGWSLTLKETNMASGTANGAANSVTWTIDGNPQDGGSWNGSFQSEIMPYEGHIPDGLTGTFNADYTDVGKLRGAYGAHIK